ncbi:hypothetical protein V6N13_012883 [Hibiscus sabdariffa]|uniref:Uncharacterized protein n=1 Tax=Hibiscus sabdariffa TaxID=183260 RepID=A0ABR2SH21_9ROSI
MGKSPFVDPKGLEFEEHSRSVSGANVACNGAKFTRSKPRILVPNVKGRGPGDVHLVEAEEGGQLRDNLECSSLGCKSDSLFEVQVEGGSEASLGSGHSISIEPKLDPSTGLYSIKPKLDSSLGRKQIFGFLPYRGKRSGGSRVSHLKSNSKRDAKEGSNMKSNLLLKEAKETLEVCESLGLKFDDKEEVILDRFMEQEVDAANKARY